jgi:hydrogenase/urease accessory protein HupE
MQINFWKASAVVAGILLPALASAHPGHAPTDFAAQVSQPFAGLDHFLAFVALSALLLGIFAFVLKTRTGARPKTHE